MGPNNSFNFYGSKRLAFLKQIFYFENNKKIEVKFNWTQTSILFLDCMQQNFYIEIIPFAIN